MERGPFLILKGIGNSLRILWGVRVSMVNFIKAYGSRFWKHKNSLIHRPPECRLEPELLISGTQN
jgi:hypothetical protein